MTFDLPKNETACIAVVRGKRHRWAEPDRTGPELPKFTFRFGGGP